MTTFNKMDLLGLLQEHGAVVHGHFQLASGLHSPVFLQKNLVFMDAARCERLCKALADKIALYNSSWSEERFYRT